MTSARDLKWLPPLRPPFGLILCQKLQQPAYFETMTSKKTENIFWMFPSNIFIKFTFRHNYVPPSNLGGYQWIIKISLKSTSLSTQPKVCFSTEWSQCIQLKYNDYNLCVFFSLMFHEDPSLVLYFFKSHEENLKNLA